MANHELKVAAQSECPQQPVVQDKSGIYQIKAEGLSAPVPTPIRHQHFVRVQQYYTGDA